MAGGHARATRGAAARRVGLRGDPAPGGAFEEFTAFWSDLAEQLRGRSILPAAYTYRLAGAAAGLAPDGFPPMRRTFFKNDDVESGPAWAADRIFIVSLRLQPGAVIPAHQHRAHSVITFVSEGDCRYRYFELIGEPPDHDDRSTAFQVRQTRGGILMPGRWARLTRAQDHIHDFQAGSRGATLLDFTTAVGESSGASPFLDITDQPTDPFPRIHEARWAENPYR